MDGLTHSSDMEDSTPTLPAPVLDGVSQSTDMDAPKQVQRANGMVLLGSKMLENPSTTVTMKVGDK